MIFLVHLFKSEWKAGQHVSEESQDPTELVDEESSAQDVAADAEVTAEAAEDVVEDPLETFKAELRSQFGEWYVIHSYARSEEHTSELQSRGHLVCRLLLENKK